MLHSLRRLFSRSAPRARQARPRTSPPLRLEALEDRLVLDAHVMGGGTYATIGAAVAAAPTGGTVTVDPGTYSESVTINKPLTLLGAQSGVNAQNGRPGAMESIVTGAGNNGNSPFVITANNVTLDGFTVEGATTGLPAVNIYSTTSGAHILNNIVRDNALGLNLNNNSSTVAAVVRYNLFQNNNQSAGGSGNAIYSDEGLTNALIDSNTFTGDSFGVVVTGNPGAQSNITVSNNTFTNEGTAVVLNNTASASILFNTISGSLESQIQIGNNANDISIRNNLIANGAAGGILITSFTPGQGPASNVRINDNSISGNAASGLTLDPASYTGALDATSNWWGSPTGPTAPRNPNGTGQIIVDAANQVRFSPYLTSGANQQTAGPGFVPVLGSLSGAPITGGATIVSGYAYSPLTNVVVATFSSGDGSIPAGAFIASINWGDNTSSTGSVVALGGGSYQVQGSHTYTRLGSYTITTQITEGSASASFSATAAIHQQLLPDGTVGNPIQNFVSQLYQDLLGRQVDSLGLTYWSALFSYYENAYFAYYYSLGLDPMTSYSLSLSAAQFQVALGIELAAGSATGQQAVLVALFASNSAYFNSASL